MLLAGAAPGGQSRLIHHAYFRLHCKCGCNESDAESQKCVFELWNRVVVSGLVVEFVKRTAFGLVVDVLLEVAHLVGDEAEDMVKGDPFEVGLVFVEVFADGVEFGDEGFGFHGWFLSELISVVAD